MKTELFQEVRKQGNVLNRLIDEDLKPYKMLLPEVIDSIVGLPRNKYLSMQYFTLRKITVLIKIKGFPRFLCFYYELKFKCKHRKLTKYNLV